MRGLSNRIVFILGSIAAMVWAAAGYAEAKETPPARPANALVLFGANWCAPCLEELKDLPGLASAAAPARLVLAWTDATPPRLWPSWPANATTMPRAAAVRMMAEFETDSAGLPFAVLLDAQGRSCAVWRGKVTRERIAALKARCAG